MYEYIAHSMSDHGLAGSISAIDALDWLRTGNQRYVDTQTFSGDISPERREEAFKGGQHPFVAIVSCSDSRVIPEVIFSAGIGELFVIRTAGNIVDDINTLGSLEYAVGHMGCNLIVVLGHTCCGAIAEAMAGFDEEHALDIINHIRDAIGSEEDPTEASKLNIRRSVRLIKDDIKSRDDVMVVGALYDIKTGVVHFLDF